MFAFMAPVFMTINSLAMLMLVRRLGDPHLASLVRFEAWFGLVSGVGILIWSVAIKGKEGRDEYGIDRPHLFVTFFFFPLDVIFLVIAIECFNLEVIGDQSVRNGLMIQLLATFVTWTTWEIKSAMKAIR